MSQLPPLDMDNMKPTALFDVFLRLRPAHTHNERFLQVQENDNEDELPTHITINPPTNDTRRKAVETFEFTGVFEEAARQRDVFDSTGILPLLEGVMGEPGKQGRDGLLATLGVSGSGKVCLRKKEEGKGREEERRGEESATFGHILMQKLVAHHLG